MKSRSTPKCPSCAAARSRRIGALPDVGVFARTNARDVLPESSLYRCSDCGLLYRHPVLDAHAYEALYARAGAECWGDDPARLDWIQIQDYVFRVLTPGSRLLDFGCHTGGLLKRLGPDFLRTGVEVNPRAAALARAESGAAIVESLSALAPGAKFDAVIAADVVEHFPDPGRVIGALLDALAPGGKLILTTGDADTLLWRIAGARWWYCFYPEHLSFISERWVRDWLRRSGSTAQILHARTFRHERLAPMRYAAQVCLLLAYLCAPRTYVRLGGQARHLLGRERIAYAPGTGLTKDHLFLVLGKERGI